MGTHPAFLTRCLVISKHTDISWCQSDIVCVCVCVCVCACVLCVCVRVCAYVCAPPQLCRSLSSAPLVPGTSSCCASIRASRAALGSDRPLSAIDPDLHRSRCITRVHQRVQGHTEECINEQGSLDWVGAGAMTSGDTQTGCLKWPDTRVSCSQVQPEINSQSLGGRQMPLGALSSVFLFSGGT